MIKLIHKIEQSLFSCVYPDYNIHSVVCPSSVFGSVVRRGREKQRTQHHRLSWARTILLLFLFVRCFPPLPFWWQLLGACGLVSAPTTTSHVDTDSGNQPRHNGNLLLSCIYVAVQFRSRAISGLSARALIRFLIKSFGCLLFVSSYILLPSCWY